MITIPASELIIEILPKRLYLGKNNLPIFRVYGDSFDKVKETVSPILRVVIGIESVKIEELKKNLAGQFPIPSGFIYRRNIVHWRRVIVEDI